MGQLNINYPKQLIPIIFHGKKKDIDNFIKKLSATIESKIDDYKAFIELQRECLEMLEEFSKKWKTDLEGMRSIGYFKLCMKDLVRKYCETLSEVAFKQQIIGSVEYLIEFLELEMFVLDTKAKFPYSAKVINYVEPQDTPSEFTWTDNKTHLIEIIQAILLLESVNNGKVVKNDFIRHIGKALNIDLTNHRSLLNDILNRYDDPDIVNARIYYIKKMNKALSEKLLSLDQKKRKG